MERSRYAEAASALESVRAERDAVNLQLYAAQSRVSEVEIAYAQVEAALGADELSTSQERRFNKLRSETVDLVKSLRLNNNRIEALIDHARAVVYEKCGVELVAEVKIVGEPRADEVSP